MSLIMYLDNIFIEKMSLTKCPNCVKDGLTVPLKEDGDTMICSLCEYSENIQ